jgi:hypothetical protein
MKMTFGSRTRVRSRDFGSVDGRSPDGAKQQVLRYAQDDKFDKSLLTDFQHDLAVVLAFLHQRVGVARLIERKHFSNHGLDLSCGCPLG